VPTRTATLPASFERVLAPVAALPLHAADRVRLYWLRALGPLAKPLVRQRELRVAVAGSTLLLLALAVTALAPLWLLALGPIVWGIPHALSDVRYLWVRPGHHRRVSIWILVGIPLLVLSITSDPSWGFAAGAGALIAARGPIWRRLAGLALVVPLIAASHLEPILAAVVFAHAHNFIGIALWWSWRRRSTRLHFLPLAIFAAGSLLILAGGLDPILHALDALDARPGGMDLYYHLSALVPGVPTIFSVRLVLLFAFAQAAHYVIWVRLVPEEDRARETPRTFAASFRALRADFGWPLLALTIGAALVLAGWAAFDLFAARTGYLRAALFHGHLEVAAAALLFVEGLRPRSSTETAQ
jgi:hypothetical protein